MTVPSDPSRMAKRTPPAGPDLKAGDLIVGYRFRVDFHPNNDSGRSIEARFRKVTGLGVRISVESRGEGRNHILLPDTVSYDNLVLERGRVVRPEFDIGPNRDTMNTTFGLCTIFVTALNEDRAAATAWKFVDAYPVSWRLSGLDATRTEVLIETLEFAYTRMELVTG